MQEAGDHSDPNCCAGSCANAAREPRDEQRRALINQAFRLEWLTIGWMVVEAAVAIASGLVAGSLALLAFGLDSVIELISAAVLIWRLSVELRDGREFSQKAERLACRIGGALLFALAAYVMVEAARALWAGQAASFSLPGVVVTALAIPIMHYLARRKIELAELLGSRALRADAIESLACGWLSLVVLISLLAQAALDAGWIDPVGSLAIVWLLLREGREAWTGEECECR